MIYRVIYRTACRMSYRRVSRVGRVTFPKTRLENIVSVSPFAIHNCFEIAILSVLFINEYDHLVHNW